MNWLLLCRNLGLLGMLVGGSMVFSLPWAFPVCGEAERFEAQGFRGIVAAIVCSVAAGGTLYYLGRNERGAILRKEALAIVGLGWVLAGLLGSLPYLFAGVLSGPGTPMTVVEAVFESVSGFTTTGASVLTDVEDPQLIPRCVLFWRSFTHWLGGMGIIVLFVAVLGQLGAGGKALMRREVPGPITEAVRPRVRETAMVMWTIYVGISLLEVVALLAVGALTKGGMNLYEALCHTFGTVATGGFSTHGQSIGYFRSWLIEATIIVFMILAGTNFSLYYLVIRRHDVDRQPGLLARLAPLYRDPEYRVYLSVLAAAVVVMTVGLYLAGDYGDAVSSFRHASFTAVSIMTTTGYGTENFQEWNEFAKGLLLLLMFVGGSAGSTGGGIKVVRFMLFFKIIRLEIEQAFRPKVVRPLKVFGFRVENTLRHEVVVYFSLILFIFVSSWMLLAAIEPEEHWRSNASETAPAAVEDESEEKLLDCASAVAATLNNIGPGLGVLGPHSNYAGFSSPGKLLLTLLMLMGRLELFAILVLFVPSFWRTQ